MSHTSLHLTGTLSKLPLLLPLSRAYLLPSPLAISEHPLTHSAMADDSPSSSLQHGQLIFWLGLNHDNMPEFPSMLHYPHARAYSVNLFSSVKVSFSFLHVSQALQLLQFPTWALHLSLSILLTGSRFLPCLPTPKPWVPASNWAQISFLCLAPQLLPSLPYRLTYFITLSINIFVFPGLLSVTCNNVYAVLTFALFLLNLDSFHMYFYFQYHYFLFHTFLLFPSSPHVSPSTGYLFPCSFWCFLSYTQLWQFLHHY